MKVTKFNVINFTNGKVIHYDVLPYFRNCWKHRSSKEKRDEILAYKQPAKRLEKFKSWVVSESRYMFWARCEYEHLVAHWPFGSYKFNEEMKQFLTPEFNIDDYKQRIDFENIIIRDMEKIDIHDQIMMNIDVIVNILYSEFKIDKK